MNSCLRFSAARVPRGRSKGVAVNGGVVLRIGERIEVLRDDGLPVRVIFDAIPPNLRARPTLSVSVDAQRAGTRPLTLSYLTPGLGWKSDYVALFDEKAGTPKASVILSLLRTMSFHGIQACQSGQAICPNVISQERPLLTSASGSLLGRAAPKRTVAIVPDQVPQPDPPLDERMASSERSTLRQNVRNVGVI